MRLLKTSSLELMEVQGENIPPYAILSHTWGVEEVTFDDLQTPGSGYHNRESWRKIEGCCKMARSNCIEYIWIDTVCIDKKSSAELSEAINSMWSWYRNAIVCYVYLQDFLHRPSFPVVPVDHDPAFPKSRWFTRGWTLQELLAPDDVVFFDRTWADLGTKLSLQGLIAKITGIREDCLNGDLHLYSVTVGERMAWAIDRETTRVEDMAYCLMGIFGINMPMLYGEGKKAFQRLQLEIMRSSNDQTIFAWKKSGRFSTDDDHWSWLAPSPEDFGWFRNLSKVWIGKGRPFSLTNNGIEIEANILYELKRSYIVLNCGAEDGDFVVPLRSAPGEDGDSAYRDGAPAISWEKGNRGNKDLRKVYLVGGEEAPFQPWRWTARITLQGLPNPARGLDLERTILYNPGIEAVSGFRTIGNELRLERGKFAELNFGGRLSVILYFNHRHQLLTYIQPTSAESEPSFGDSSTQYDFLNNLPKPTDRSTFSLDIERRVFCVRLVKRQLRSSESGFFSQYYSLYISVEGRRHS